MAVITYKCPNCGGELVFDPDSQKYKCPYCMSSFSQAELDAMAPAQGTEEEVQSQDTETDETAANEQPAYETDENGAVIYKCPSCGAEIVTDETTAATFCYYCHNPVVLEGRVSGEYMPDHIIPFKISRDKAVKAFGEYIKTKKYVPKAFYNEKQIEKLTGVYYPYWDYDTTVAGSMRAEGTKLKVWMSGDTEFTETSVYDVVRSGKVKYDEMLANALAKSDRALVTNVLPYDLGESVPFNMSYLSGFVAEKRDMESSEFADRFRSDTDTYTKNLFRESMDGYASLKVTDSKNRPVKENWKYTLLPVWVLTYRAAGGETFYFAMNGQTGKVCGKLPVDNKRLTMTSALIGIGIAAVIAIAGFLL